MKFVIHWGAGNTTETTNLFCNIVEDCISALDIDHKDENIGITCIPIDQIKSIEVQP